MPSTQHLGSGSSRLTISKAISAHAQSGLVRHRSLSELEKHPGRPQRPKSPAPLLRASSQTDSRRNIDSDPRKAWLRWDGTVFYTAVNPESKREHLSFLSICQSSPFSSCDALLIG